MVNDIRDSDKNILISSHFFQKKKLNAIKDNLIKKYKMGNRIEDEDLANELVWVISESKH